MSQVNDRLEAQGSWSLDLRPHPDDDLLSWLDHIAITPGRVPVVDDTILDQARYIGVYLDDGAADDSKRRIGGAGLIWWLGDHEGKGRVIELPVDLAGDSFADSIRAVLNTDDVAEGTLHSVGAGTYTGRHQWQTPRQAIAYICGVFDANFEVVGDSSDGAILNAGPADDLWGATPTAVVARRQSDDPDLTVLAGAGQRARDARDLTSRVVLLAAGIGDTVATGEADAAGAPGLNLRGNAAQITRLVNESETSSGNADARAQLHLNRYSSERQAFSVRIDRPDVAGDLRPGRLAWVYDPDGGLVDLTNELPWQGGVINPVALRIHAVTWPIVDGMGVYARLQDGSWLDLTDRVIWGSGTTSVEVGAGPRTLTSPGSPAGDRPYSDPDATDTTIPDVPATVTPFASSVYLDAEGRTRARIVVEWATPLNTDASTITDGDYFEIRWRVTGQADWQYGAAGWGETTFAIEGLDPGVSYDIAVQAVDRHGNKSGWSATDVTVAQADTIPPSQPAPPSVVAGGPLRIQVVHELGKATGGTFNLEGDLDHLEVHVGATSGFATSSATLVGKIPATAAHLTLGLAVIGEFDAPDDTERFVKVIAVDHAGNQSAASDAASVTADLIATAHIGDATITTAKIGDLAVTTAKIANAAVDTAQIADASITTAKIVAAAITTAEIDNAAVTTAKIADASITTAKIANAQITTATIANAAVTNAKISDLAASKITAGTISGVEIIIAGGTSGILRSSNFTAGSAGWRVRGDGSAEFNNVTVRGRLLAIDPADSDSYVDINPVGDNGSPSVALTNPANDGWELFVATDGKLNIVGLSGTRAPITDDVIIAGGLIVNNQLSTGAITSTSTIRSADGSAGAPGHGFSSDPNTGMFWSSSFPDEVLITTGGTNIVSFDSGGGGQLIPDSDNTRGLGASSRRWTDVWAVDTTINSSDERSKELVEASDLGLAFVRALQPVRFRREGRARIHHGFTAQQIRDALAAVGVADAAMFVDPAVRADQLDQAGCPWHDAAAGWPDTLNPHDPGNRPAGDDTDGLAAWNARIRCEKHHRTIDDMRAAPLGIRIGELIGPLVAAVQELADQVDTLTPQPAGGR